MRRIGFVLIMGLLFSVVEPINASIKPGTSCKKVNELMESNKQVLVCAKAGTKLRWKIASSAQTTKYFKKLIAEKAATEKAATEKAATEKAATEKAATEKAATEKAATEKAATEKAATEKAAAACAVSLSCKVGDKGPGGGIVFFDAGSQQSWGRYLEYAPDNWNGSLNDPSIPWCNITNIDFRSTVTDPSIKATLGYEIGQGKANTNLIKSKCSSGAAVLASGYRGGGKSDWYLPSRNELTELCNYSKKQIQSVDFSVCATGSLGKTAVWYWSSSEGGVSTAWIRNFFNSDEGNDQKSYGYGVRPTRSF